MEEKNYPFIMIEHIIDSIPAQIYFKNTELRYIWVNERYLQYKRISREQVIGKTDYDIYPEEQASNIVKEDRKVLETGFEVFYEHYSEGTDRYFAIRKTAIKGESGEVSGILAVVFDITEEKRIAKQLELANQELEESRERFRDILENANDFIISMAEDGGILYANKSFLNTMRIPEVEIPKRNIFDFLPADSREQVYMIFDSIKKGIKIGHSEFNVLLPDGRRLVVEGSFTYRKFIGKAPYILGIFRDVTQRKLDEEKIRFLAYHDVLTGLPNRLLFFDRINLEINRAIRNGTLVAVMIMDLDRFKMVNDTFGHNVGDELLKEVSNRVKGVVRKIDTVARLGGDEFVIILSELKNNSDVDEIAERIVVEISRPYKIENETIEISPSIGISIFPTDGNDPDFLIRKADMAMYKSKSKGGKSFSYYSG